MANQAHEGDAPPLPSLPPEAGNVATGLRLLILALALWMLVATLEPVVLGALLALILHPLQHRLARRMGRFKRWLPALMTVATLVLVLLPLTLMAVQLVEAINHFLARDLVELMTNLRDFGNRHLAEIGARLDITGADLGERFRDGLELVGTKAATWTSALVAGLPGQIVALFMFSVSLFFFLRDGEKFLVWLRRVLPFPAADIKALYGLLDATVRGAILGQLATSAVQGTLTMVALFAFRIPGAFVFGVVATLMSVIPLLGTTPVTLGATIYLLVVGRFGAAMGMLAAAVVIGVSDNVVRPWTQSGQTPMHPLLILTAIFGGVELFGASGVFLGPIVAALAQWTVAIYAAHIDRQRNLVLPGG